jgi:outer membrane protein assembly factor BamB
MLKRCTLFAVAVVLAVAGAAAADDWPQWRGPDRSNRSKEKGLLQQWPKDGPKLLWKKNTAGLGFSGFAVVGDVAYTMGARSVKGVEEEYAIAYSVKDGSELWATKLGPIFTFKGNGWGDGPRATPTVDGDFVYCLGGQGELVCLNAKSKGAVVWRKNLIKDFKGQIMVYSQNVTGPTGWGYCESPLIDGDQLVCCPGGPDGWMIALDKKTGNVLWRTKDLKDEATDSSIVVAEIGGVRQYINSTFKGNPDGGGVAGIDTKTGKVLWFWQNKKYNVYAVCPTPVVDKDLVYVTAGYDIGCNCLKVSVNGGKFAAEDTYTAAKQVITMKNEHGGVLLLDGYIYGSSDGGGWTCQELKTGKKAWSDRNSLEGKGSLTYADGRLYLVSDQGEIVLLEPSPKGWSEKGRFSLPELSKTREDRPTHQYIGVWTHPVVANGRLYLRDQEFIYCYDVAAKR